jgi:hypothetical protein
MARVEFCQCEKYKRWYESVCRCGHRDEDHVNCELMCIGDVFVIPADSELVVLSTTELG